MLLYALYKSIFFCVPLPHTFAVVFLMEAITLGCFQTDATVNCMCLASQTEPDKFNFIELWQMK